MTEALWSGPFGTAYFRRNLKAVSSPLRERFWREFYLCYPWESVLEVGAGSGANLRWLRGERIVGTDINDEALAFSSQWPGVEMVKASIMDLPFNDGEFDLCLVSGVLIHVAPADLLRAIRELVRCSSKYVLAIEYAAQSEQEIEYRGQRSALWKRPYGRLFSMYFPQLEELKRGFLGKGDGWDDCNYWFFRK